MKLPVWWPSALLVNGLLSARSSSSLPAAEQGQAAPCRHRQAGRERSGEYRWQRGHRACSAAARRAGTAYRPASMTEGTGRIHVKPCSRAGRLKPPSRQHGPRRAPPSPTSS